MIKRARLSPRIVGTVLAAAVVAVGATTLGTAFASTGRPAATMSMSAMSSMSRGDDPCGLGGPGCHRTGVTDGWLNGRTVDFLYTHRFFCAEPPASRAPSECEAGANYQQVPSRNFDPLYVVVPIGFTPPRSTLQCPVAGHCIDHPSRIDLSRVFGSAAGNVLLPAHSHIVTTANGNKGEFWDVVVVGVPKLSAWNQIVRGKSFATLQALQREGAVTGDIPTNLFLYFTVLRGGEHNPL